MSRFGMVIDLKECLGCQACTVACKVEHGTPPGIFWNRVTEIEEGEYPAVRKYFLPRLCMHCKNPSCVEVCPTGASHQREDGIVLIDHEKCMGCKYCIVACPFGARYFNEENRGYFGDGLTPYEKVMYREHQTGVVEKCNFCVERLDAGQQPACVGTCIARARYFGDLDDPDSEVSQLIRRKHGYRLLEELDNSPSVYYLPA